MDETLISRRRFWPALMFAIGNWAAPKLPWLMRVMAVIETAFGGVLIWLAILLRQANGGNYEAEGAILLALGALLTLGSVILGLLFLPWIYRSYAWLQERGIELPWSPAYAAGCWLIPIVNFYRPYQVMVALWRATTPAANTDEDVRPRLINVWWGILLSSVALSWTARLLEILGRDIRDLAVIVPVVMGASFSVAALVLSSMIVRRLEARMLRTMEKKSETVVAR